MVDLLHVIDEKSQDTEGGASTALTWEQRDLNTVLTDEITGASLASDQITLPAGTYFIKAEAPGFRVNYHKLRLRNITDGTTAVVGSSCFAWASVGVQTSATLRGRFTIAATKTFELQHWTEAASATNGLGVATDQDEVEVYADVRITDIP